MLSFRCMSLFIVGSVVSGFATSMPILLIGRGIQGIGAGGLMPLAMVIFGDTLTVEERARTQGAVGAIMFIRRVNCRQRRPQPSGRWPEVAFPKDLT